jgi:autophagy-related protein 9
MTYFHNSIGLNTSHAHVFLCMVQYTGMMLLEDMASIFLTPYLLLFIVPKVIFILGDFVIWHLRV